MFKYSSFCLAVLLCYTQWATALPKLDTLDQPDKVKLNQDFSTLISSVIDLVSTLKTTVIDNFLMVAARSMFALNLRLEFYTMATGNHFSVFTSKDPKHHKIAAFVVQNCLAQLDRMEEADEILKSAAKNAAESILLILRGKVELELPKAIVPLFDRFESYIKSDPQLSSEFERFEYNDNLQEHKVFFPQEYASNITKMEAAAVQWLSNRKIQKILLHLTFLRNGYNKFTVLFKGTDYERHVLVKSILCVGHRPETKQLAQKLYDEAIFQTAQQFGSEYDRNALAGSKDNKVFDQLYDILEEKFTKSTALNMKFEEAKKDIAKNLLTTETIINIESWLPF